MFCTLCNTRLWHLFPFTLRPSKLNSFPCLFTNHLIQFIYISPITIFSTNTITSPIMQIRRIQFRKFRKQRRNTEAPLDTARSGFASSWFSTWHPSTVSRLLHNKTFQNVATPCLFWGWIISDKWNKYLLAKLIVTQSSGICISFLDMSQLLFVM